MIERVGVRALMKLLDLWEKQCVEQVKSDTVERCIKELRSMVFEFDNTLEHMIWVDKSISLGVEECLLLHEPMIISLYQTNDLWYTCTTSHTSTIRISDSLSRVLIEFTSIKLGDLYTKQIVSALLSVSTRNLITVKRTIGLGEKPR